MPVIRRVRTDDAWDEAIAVLGQLWTDADEGFLRSFREEDGYHLFGRYVDGALVGVAGVSVQRVLHHARHAWIHDLVVDAEHRREGHGRALLEHCEAWARDRGCEYVALALRAGNDAAGDFYESAGFQRWGAVLERPLDDE